jgi:hypothetical protein
LIEIKSKTQNQTTRERERDKKTKGQRDKEIQRDIGTHTKKYNLKEVQKNIATYTIHREVKDPICCCHRKQSKFPNLPKSESNNKKIHYHINQFWKKKLTWILLIIKICKHCCCKQQILMRNFLKISNINIKLKFLKSLPNSNNS